MPPTTDPTLLEIVNEQSTNEDTLWSDICDRLSELVYRFNLNSEEG